MGDSSITVGDVEISHLYDLVANWPMTLDQAFPAVPAEAWEPYRREYPSLFGPGTSLASTSAATSSARGGGRSWWTPA